MENKADTITEQITKDQEGFAKAMIDLTLKAMQMTLKLGKMPPSELTREEKEFMEATGKACIQVLKTTLK